VEKYIRTGQATDGHITRRMRFACWITKATDTHSEYVIVIAFPRQKWLRERASMLRYAYIAYVVNYQSYHYILTSPKLHLCEITRIRLFITGTRIKQLCSHSPSLGLP
jgi:hypothetical protein